MGHMVFIENLNPTVTQQQLAELIAQHGEFESIEMARDEESDDETQVAFVAMKNAKCGRALIAGLDGKTHWERPLKAKALKQHHQFQEGQAGGGGGAAAGGIARRFGGRGGMYGHRSRGLGGGRHK